MFICYKKKKKNKRGRDNYFLANPIIIISSTQRLNTYSKAIVQNFYRPSSVYIRIFFHRSLQQAACRTVAFHGHQRVSSLLFNFSSPSAPVSPRPLRKSLLIVCRGSRYLNDDPFPRKLKWQPRTCYQRRDAFHRPNYSLIAVDELVEDTDVNEFVSRKNKQISVSVKLRVVQAFSSRTLKDSMIRVVE